MNFGNFGKGGTKESMYIHGGETHKKFIEKRKVVGMITTIHTNQFTLKLLKEIFDSYKNIKLDDLIKKNFYK